MSNTSKGLVEEIGASRRFAISSETQSTWALRSGPEARVNSASGGVRTPENEWVVRTNAFEPIIDEHTFRAAQKLITQSKSDQYLLDRLRFLLATAGSLGRWEIRTTPGIPCEQTYVNRFGSLRK